MTDTAPVLLPPNQFPHFYRGGDRIGALRGGPGGPMRPEEWLGSTVTRFGEAQSGLSLLPDGRLLRDAVAADPLAWLGPEHLAAYGDSTELLVKLLDPDQRLPVHFHPDKAFARRHLALDHGKTEAWIVLEAPEGAGVGLGFSAPMTKAQVLDLVQRRDSATLLASLHRRAVRAGETVLVPAGVPHAIDAGVLVLELQEPTDLSALLEWDGFAVDGERDGHLGLGFPTVLDALRLDPLSPDEREDLVRDIGLSGGEVRSLLTGRADGYFRAELLPGSGAVVAGFAVCLVLAGAGQVQHGGRRHARRGSRRGVRGPVVRRSLAGARGGRRRVPGAEARGCGGCPVTRVLVGVDIGTTRVKAVATDLDLRVLGEHTVATPWRHHGANAEVDPAALAARDGRRGRRRRPRGGRAGAGRRHHRHGRDGRAARRPRRPARAGAGLARPAR